MVNTYLSSSSTYRFIFLKVFSFEKNQDPKFWWYFKVPHANCLWANFSTFGQIWADFVAIVVAET